MRDQTKKFETAILTLDEALFDSRREYLAVRYASLLADRPFRVTDDFLGELREEFDEGEILEMTFACATFSWGNIIGIALRVDLHSHEHYSELDWPAAEARKRQMAIDDLHLAHSDDDARNDET